jgi:hypothetical protein
VGKEIKREEKIDGKRHVEGTKEKERRKGKKR